MKEYGKERGWLPAGAAGLLIFIYVYFGYLVHVQVYREDLLYLEGILLAAVLGMTALDYRNFRRKQRRAAELEELLESALEEAGRLRVDARQQGDYIARWAHEVKLPLSALQLMNERNPDPELEDQMKECLERIRRQLNTMLMSGKLRTLENDVVFRKLPLAEVVREAVKNQSYFLIRQHFEIDLQLGGIQVYSDRRWLVYMLDQMIANAVKYRRDTESQEKPRLVFGAEKLTENEVKFWIEDNGIGIRKEDLPYIFDRGYIGGNLRDGDYRSTGMGLYFVKEAAGRLGIRLEAAVPELGGTRMELHFTDNASFFHLDEETLQEC